MIFKFAGFILNNEQKTLFHNKKEVALTKKCYQLLFYLLNHPNKPVTREQLIKHVWDNRVVTENTIDQCISKLRKALNSAQSGEYIKSIYGQGIQFTVPVKLQTDNNKSQLIMICCILLTMVLLVSIYFKPQKPTAQSLPTSQPSSEQNHKVKLSILPFHNSTVNPEDPNDWFISGGSQYLTALFANSLHISRISPKPEWLNKEDKSLLAVDIINQNQADVVALSDFRFDGKQYHADITLRNSQGLMAQQHFQTLQINDLMKTVLAWIENELAMNSNLKETQSSSSDFSDDEYALESYIRALSAQAVGDSKKAIAFLQVATEQDPNFKLAWYELAVAYRKQGNYLKALALLNTLDQASEQLLFKIALTKGHTYDGIKQFEDAMQAYDEAYAVAIKLEDNLKLASVLISQSISTINLQQFKTSQEKLDQALSYINLEKDPHMFGTLMNTYAKLEKARNQTNKAIEYVEKSIQAFVISGDKRYEMQARTRLASLLLRTGKFAEAEELSLAAMAYAKQQQQLRSISSNHFKLALIYQHTGRFKAALEHWEDALTINAELGIADEKAAIYEYLIELEIARSDLQSAENYLMRLFELRDQQPTNTIKHISLRAALKLALAQKDLTQANQLLNEYKKSENNQFQELFQGDLSLLENNQPLAIDYYQKALNQLKDSGENIRITEVMNKLTSIYLKSDLQQAEFNLNQTEQFNPFVYPFMKYQAMLLYQQQRHFEAVTMLQELKLKANDFWQTEDQLLLEQFQVKLKESSE